jgi:hypothetical protein
VGPRGPLIRLLAKTFYQAKTFIITVSQHIWTIDLGASYPIVPGHHCHRYPGLGAHLQEALGPPHPEGLDPGPTSFDWNPCHP